MSETALKRTVVVANRAGMHARAAVLTAETARRFPDAQVMIAKGNARVGATDVLQILSLGGYPGDTLELEATGAAAAEALEALAELFARKFGEDEFEETG